MADFTDPAVRAYTLHRSGVGVEPQRHAAAKVEGHAAQAEPLAGTLDYPGCSASPKLGAAAFCVLAQCFSKWPPRMPQPP